MNSKFYKNDACFPADADILPLVDDRIFKTVLTHPDAKCILIDVISTIIDRTVIDVQVRNNELPLMDINEKAERFDVNCTIDNGDQIDVEMHCFQRKETGIKRTNFINKYIYYLADLHSSQESKSLMYPKLVRTYQVTFSTHTILPERKDFVSRFTLRTEDGEQLSDQLTMIIIELDKLNYALEKPVEKLTSFEKWSLFFKYAPDTLHREKINGIIIDKEEIGMAATLLKEISKDERERAINRSRRMAESDRLSDLYTAKLEGIAEGEVKGKSEGKAEVISLLEKGLTLEEIKKTLNS